MSEDDAELTRVIISCLAASKESMWLLQLQDDLQEICDGIPQDSLTKFIIIQCGSFLKVVLEWVDIFQYYVVKFNHPSFLSFVSMERYRTEFSFDVKEYHIGEVLRSLKILLTDIDASKKSSPQKIAWTVPLPKAAKSGVKAIQLLIYIYRLFTPNSTNQLFRWFQETLQSDERFNKAPVSSLLLQDNPAMQTAIQNITQWVSECRIKSVDNTTTAKLDKNELQRALDARSLLSDPSHLKFVFAKLAAYDIFYGKFPIPRTPMQLSLMFALAFRCFCEHKHLSAADIIQDLIQKKLQGND